MQKSYEQLKRKEKIFNFTVNTLFFLVGFAVMMMIMSFISSL